jgi:cytochrome c peroxidase
MRTWITFLSVMAIGVLSSGDVRAADENAGLTLFKKGGCNECHAISALGVQKEAKKKSEGAAQPAEPAEPAATDADSKKKKDKEAPDLSGAGLEHDAKWISAFLNKEETLNGEKHEKRFKGTEADRRTIAMFLAGLKTKPKDAPAAAGEKKEGGQ